jgi:formylglycine-generating enzyme required for sulfatase activity
MSGNVWEWVNALSDENLYSLRGGSWLAFDIPAKSAYRFGTVQNSSYGFRCARDLDA